MRVLSYKARADCCQSRRWRLFGSRSDGFLTAPSRLYNSFYDSPDVASLQARDERSETAIPDFLWGNRPDPYEHLFRLPYDLPGVVCYRKRS
jgi:hypothetical protein